MLRQAYSDGFYAVRLAAAVVAGARRSFGYASPQRLGTDQATSRIDPSFQT